MEPEVDVVIAVHSSARPIHRAVASVLDHTESRVRVTVVCHNIGRALIAANLADRADDQRVRLIELADSTRSPAGPFNAGLDAATAAFTSVLGSDDELEPGAVDSWLAAARVDGADVVIPRLTMAAGGAVPTPPTRPFRRRNLNGVADRLAYRTAQLGLVSRARFPDLRFTAGLTTGEDISYGLRLWFSSARIAFDRRGPGYLIHDESDDRTSTAVKPVTDDFAFLEDALESDWVASLTPQQRHAIVVKLLRTTVMEALQSRLAGGKPLDGDADALGAVVRRLLSLAPTALRVLSARDARILTRVAERQVDDALRGDLALRADYRRLGNLISASPLHSLQREAPVRFLGALALTR